MDIRIDDLSGPQIARFLEEHMTDMHIASPPESIHALDLEGLRKPEITFWSVWDAGALIACGAFKELDAKHAELKSMRTSPAVRGTGVGSKLLAYMLNVARERGYQRISLETGSMAFFEPARKLYERHGFEVCGPFSGYVLDPNSVFMTKVL
jgi:putative acetyltransferase